MSEAPKKPFSRIVTVTPEMAAKWLETANVDNRSLRERSAQRIAQDIKNGNFCLTNQAIGFDVNGVLVDGQHRLMGVVLAKKSVEMFVCYNLSTSSRMFIDGGAQRSFADVAKFRHGSQVNARVGAVTRSMMDPFCRCNYSRYQQVLFFEKHQEAILKAIDLFRGCSSELATSQVISVIARATYSIKEESLKRFVDILKDPITSFVRPTERAACIMREDLIRTAQDGRNRRMIYRRCEFLLNCFLAKNSKPSRKGIADEEQFPIPGEPAFKSPAKAA